MSSPTPPHPFSFETDKLLSTTRACPTSYSLLVFTLSTQQSPCFNVRNLLFHHISGNVILSRDLLPYSPAIHPLRPLRSTLFIIVMSTVNTNLPHHPRMVPPSYRSLLFENGDLYIPNSTCIPSDANTPSPVPNNLLNRYHLCASLILFFFFRFPKKLQVLPSPSINNSISRTIVHGNSSLLS